MPDPQMEKYVLEGPFDRDICIETSGPEEERRLTVEQCLILRWNRTIQGKPLFGSLPGGIRLKAARIAAGRHAPETIAQAFKLMAADDCGHFKTADDLAAWRILDAACIGIERGISQGSGKNLN